MSPKPTGAPPPKPVRPHRPADLCDKAKAFLREYAICVDIEKAQLAVGYKAHHGNGRRILNDPRAARYLKEHTRKADQLAQVHLAWALANLKQIACGNIFDLIDRATDAGKAALTAGGFRLDLSKLTREQAYAISELGFDTNGAPKIKFHDKVAANRLIKEHLAPDKPQRVRLEGPNGGPVEIVESLGERLNAARARRRQKAAA